MISQKRLEEFRRIYRDRYGVDLPPDKAREIAGRLVALFRLITQPLPDTAKPPADVQIRPSGL